MKFDPSPLLDEEYEIFVAQNVERLPAEKLLEVFPQIKKKAVTVRSSMRVKPRRIPFITNLTGMLLYVLTSDTKIIWSKLFLLKGFI